MILALSCHIVPQEGCERERIVVGKTSHVDL